MHRITIYGGQKGMIGFIYAVGLGDGEIAVDFNEALGGETAEGDIVLVVRLDAIEPVHSFS
jgi:hypothetical protein